MAGLRFTIEIEQGPEPITATVRITVLAPPAEECPDLAADTVLHSPDPDPDRESFNCACEDGDRNVDTLCNLRERMIRRLGFVDPVADGAPRTLAELRRDLLVRLGYAASADRPPPGMPELLNQIIAESEQLLWERLELDRGSDSRPPRMEQDTDTTTLSAQLVFAHALGMAKAHAGKRDAELHINQAEKRMQDYVQQSPPGIRATIDDFLREAQRFLYEKVATFRQTRYFRWPLEEGVRFYGYWSHEGGCGPFLPEMIEGAYVSYGDDSAPSWRPLASGIDPLLHHRGNRTGLPERYEMRRCIELWPAPDERGGFLRIKGKFDLNRFTEDDDTTTIDADVVFLLALANAKAHFNQPDAQKYDQLAQSRIGDIIAATHHTNRYIPGDPMLPSATPPKPKDGFLPS